MNFLTLWFHKMGSPPTFYRIAGRLLPWLYVLTLDDKVQAFSARDREYRRLGELRVHQPLGCLR